MAYLEKKGKFFIDSRHIAQLSYENISDNFGDASKVISYRYHWGWLMGTDLGTYFEVTESEKRKITKWLKSNPTEDLILK